MSGPSELTLFIGRLHPLLVHLPIGLIVLLAGLELLARIPRFRHANASAGFILALAVPAAVFTVVVGWLLSWAGGYEARLLQWHKWTGLATAAVCALAGWLYWLDRKRLYHWCLFSSFLVLVVASHFGGSLTHGRDYLVRYAPQPWRKLSGPTNTTQTAAGRPPAVNDLPTFTAIVQPVLQQNCVACHGPEKAKGGLRVDSLAALLKGGEGGPAVVPGKAAESPLLQRVLLPLDHDDHMPPEGKPQPSAEETALLKWWIETGASTNKVGDLKPPPKVARILETRFGQAAAAAPKPTSPKPLKAVLPLADQLADELNISITALAPNEPWLQCNASLAGTNFGDTELARLSPLGANLRWLDLAGTRVTDQGLSQLTTMPNLVRLHLERTALTDAGLGALDRLASLEYLNLYSTEITEAGLKSLASLPRLKQVYLWQTKVTPEAAQAFVAARMDQEQLARWQEEIEQLKRKIQDQHLTVELGTPLSDKPGTDVLNTLCPVSGKPVDRAQTLLHKGKTIAFCCEDCKAKFQQDPQPFLAKLALNSQMPEPKKQSPQ